MSFLSEKHTRLFSRNQSFGAIFAERGHQYGFIVLLFVVLLLPNLFVTFLSSDLSGDVLKKIVYLTFSLFVLLVPALFLKLRWYFTFESIFMLIAPFEIGYVWVNKSTSTVGYISSLFNTNKSETIELLVTLKLLIVILLIVWIAYYYIVFRKIKNTYLFKRNISIAVFIVIIFFNMLLFSSMYLLEYRRTKSGTSMDAVAGHFLNKYRKTYPCNIISIIIIKYMNHQLVSGMQENMATFTFQAQQALPPEGREIYLVVIGESARYGNFSINGYDRETSPLLEKTNGLLSYHNVYASSNVTEYALSFLLSRATPLNPEQAYREKSLVEAFKECGFYTAWISNQSCHYPYIERIAKDADYTHLSFNDSDVDNHDGQLLKYIEAVLDKNEPKTLMVVHTMGSHFRYNYRYPKEFERFTPALQSSSDYALVNKTNKPLLINSYDNTILYTDYMLSEIIKRVADTNSLSVVLYVSDHAENLYDDGSSLFLHGTKNPPEKEIHVPLFIWTSTKYQIFYASKQQSLEANINAKISASNLFDSIVDMAGITYPEENPEKSIASASFKEDSIRFVYSANNEVILFQ